MDLNDYPRPANDTGIGIHWSAGQAAAVGMGKIRDFWIPELRAMGVKWVKIFNHDGALDFCELLLAEGFFPIVRLYRQRPDPGLLGVKERVHLDTLIRVGVRYFEFNNEPDVDVEWKGAGFRSMGCSSPSTAQSPQSKSFWSRGMPAIPALSNGSQWDLVGRIVAARRRDLLDGPVWQAVRNYPRNRPLDYPYDSGNQEGGVHRAFLPGRGEQALVLRWLAGAHAGRGQPAALRPAQPGESGCGRPCLPPGLRTF
jgi:hypothetical protein